MDTNPVTVLGLEVENVKRIKALRIEPPATGLVKVAGRNDQGKSSTLDAIMLALGGTTGTPALPLRQGAKTGRVIVTLGPVTVERKWTAAGSYLQVTQDGRPLRRPQEFLDALVGAGLGFDPLAFLRMKPAAQVETLLGLLALTTDPRDLESQKRTLYDERMQVNREVKRLTMTLASTPVVPPETPETEVSVAELAEEHRALVALQSKYHALEQEIQRHEHEADTAMADVDRLERELAQAKERAVLAKTASLELGLALRHFDLPDLTAITEQMQDAEATNRQVRTKLARQDLARTLHESEERAEGLTAQMAAIDAQKTALLSSATFPVSGLGFEEVAGGWVVTHAGIPLEQCAHSVQLKVGVAMAMAVNPQCRLILIRDGSTLDADNVALLQTMALDRGFQVWLELVGDGDAESFVIVDGGVVQWPRKR